MPSLVLPNTLTPGAYEDVGDVQENFTAIRSLVNGGLDGTNLSQTAGEQLGVSATNYPRRSSVSWLGTVPVTSSTYTQIGRAPVVTMPTAGVLHVALWTWCRDTPGTGGTVSVCVQLNGVTARSRFGVAPASGVSSGRMELVGFGVPATTGHSLGAYVLVHSDTTDTGLNYLASSNVGPVDNTAAGHPVGAFVPITVGPGNYVVDFMARADTGGPYYFVGSMFTKTEAF